ncbi:MAG: hypothetical protein CM1200mP12_06970 [Gammaproteobacteria bacterium]|nr:MAG: hypothetical protein CM1200mP12_06970 [Gammaproteobacteria bacterium]
MKKIGGGCIINNSSVAAHVYGQGPPLYSSLKAAVSHYTRMAGVSLGPFKFVLMPSLLEPSQHLFFGEDRQGLIL